jgi:hypothetical protein
LKAFVLSLYDVRPTSVFAETPFSRERLLKPPVRNRALLETIEKLLLIKTYILQDLKEKGYYKSPDIDEQREINFPNSLSQSCRATDLQPEASEMGDDDLFSEDSDVPMVSEEFLKIVENRDKDGILYEFHYNDINEEKKMTDEEEIGSKNHEKKKTFDLEYENQGMSLHCNVKEFEKTRNIYDLERKSNIFPTINEAAIPVVNHDSEWNIDDFDPKEMF